MASTAEHTTVKETVSRCTTETVTGAHTFEIVGYSLKKGIGTGKSYESGTFTVGGYTWVLSFCPDGLTKQQNGNAWLHLRLVSANAEVRAWHEVRLVKRASGAMGSGWTSPEPRTYSTVRGGNFPSSQSFQMKSDQRLEASGYIKDDCLAVRCEITVIKETRLEATGLKVSGRIDVPPSDITAHLGKLLEGEGADVTFSVGGELFPAHKTLLFARSPVLKGQLLGPMRDKATDCVIVDDIQPEVFRALLHFIYTDSLPDLGDLEGDDYCEMIRHLLVAADIYVMDRLKMLCQSVLAKKLDTKTVATTLGLADLHNCNDLKEVCIEFLNSSDEDDMQAVMETKGYANLKRSCPAVLVEVYERSKRRKT
ncbi:hypothetical protein EJB05_09037, partial [Eragrostis curvula]